MNGSLTKVNLAGEDRGGSEVCEMRSKTHPTETPTSE
jgi:hypothetical protein